MRINYSIQKEIVRLLNWDDDRYSKFILECGVAYLYAYIKGESTEVISEIRTSKVFWNWWKLQWEQRDQEFIDGILEEIRPDVARQLYQLKHDPAILASELYLSGEALGESYASMIEQLNKEVAA